MRHDEHDDVGPAGRGRRQPTLRGSPWPPDRRISPWLSDRRGRPALRWLPALLRPVRLLVMLLLVVLLLPLAVVAQAGDPPVGSRLRVANTEGQSLNLRAGAGPSEAIVARLPEGTELEVVGAARPTGGGRWIEVRAPGGERGWVSFEYVGVASTPPPTATPTPRATPTPEPAPTATQAPVAEASTTSPEAIVSEAIVAEATPGREGGKLDVEAKVKFPETSGKSQEITVWTTRRGVPVQDVQVTAVSDDGGEDDPLLREFDKTNDEGKTTRTFTIKKEKGNVRVAITAIAPDGGKGAAIVEYFKR